MDLRSAILAIAAATLLHLVAVETGNLANVAVKLGSQVKDTATTAFATLTPAGPITAGPIAGIQITLSGSPISGGGPGTPAFQTKLAGSTLLNKSTI